MTADEIAGILSFCGIDNLQLQKSEISIHP